MPKTSAHSARGPSQRQLRVGEVIRRALADVLMRGDVGDPEIDDASITVSEVRVTPDLRHATVFALPLGGVNTDGAVRALARNRHEIRRLVTREISLKFSPELSFAADSSFDRMDRTRELLDAPAVRRDLESD